METLLFYSKNLTTGTIIEGIDNFSINAKNYNNFSSLLHGRYSSCSTLLTKNWIKRLTINRKNVARFYSY